MTVFVELHVLQSLPSNNINRDQDGMNKSCMFGGRSRARVSSQCWKRAVRLRDRQQGLPEQHRAERSRKWYEVLRDMLVERQHEMLDSENMAEMALEPLGYKREQPSDRLNLMAYLGRVEVEAIADLLHGNWAVIEPELHGKKPGLPREIIKAIEKTVSRAAAPGEIALYGRMMASLPSGNVDSAVQVAHAISTHAIEQEFDYFTAVDDLIAPEGEEAVTGHIGDTPFSSAVFYRYANVSVDKLAENLGGRDLLPVLLRGFAESFVKSMPSGHQNGYAALALPSVVLMTVRQSQPFSLVNAFEQPARAQRGRSLLENSVQKLALHWAELEELYGDRDLEYTGMAIATSLVEHSGNLSVFRVEGGLDALLDQVVERAIAEVA